MTSKLIECSLHVHCTEPWRQAAQQLHDGDVYP